MDGLITVGMSLTPLVLPMLQETPTRVSKTRMHRITTDMSLPLTVGCVGKNHRHPGGRGLAGGVHHHR